MSKRQRVSNSSSVSAKPQAKRIKAGISIGAPSVDDRRVPSEYNPSSSALSVRELKQQRPPLLTSLCIRVVSDYFGLFSDEDHWDSTRRWLQIIPETILPALFAMLKLHHPRLLNHAVITTYFLRGSSVSLTGELGITAFTLSAIPRVLGDKLRNLELSDIDKFSDSNYTAMVKGLPSLTSLCLRNCTKVGPSTVEAAANNCPNLKKVNLSFTSITALSLLPMLKFCLDIEVLKLAGVQNLSDSTLSRLFSLLPDRSDLETKQPLKSLKSLKLRHNTITEAALLPFLQRCPNLERVDVSFTIMKRVPDFIVALPIEKLSLTSTFIPSKELIELISRLPRLKVLNIGAMGVKAGTSTAIMSSTAMTLNDETLRLLTDALRDCPSIEVINLVQNSKLGTTKRGDSCISYFIRHIGRNLQYLNLSGVAVRSEDLVGLVPEAEEDQPSPLKTLILNKSLIDDDCAPWISGCPHIEALEFAETRISEDGLIPIIDNCPKLAKLNLTGCRGVKIADRRRFFEVWEERQGSNM